MFSTVIEFFQAFVNVRKNWPCPIVTPVEFRKSWHAVFQLLLKGPKTGLQ
jgi:hypothetical protein